MDEKPVWNELKIWKGIMEINDVMLRIADKYGVKYELVREIFWTAFASYLDRERRRHSKDIVQIKADLEALAEKGFESEYIPSDLWIAIP